jgi:hypothetical protein
MTQKGRRSASLRVNSAYVSFGHGTPCPYDFKAAIHEFSRVRDDSKGFYTIKKELQLYEYKIVLLQLFFN